MPVCGCLQLLPRTKIEDAPWPQYYFSKRPQVAVYGLRGDLWGFLRPSMDVDFLLALLYVTSAGTAQPGLHLVSGPLSSMGGKKIALRGGDGTEAHLPNPPLPLLGRRAARGVWAGAALPAVTGGGGVRPQHTWRKMIPTSR